jgi:hypothetical protein
VLAAVELDHQPGLEAHEIHEGPSAAGA